MRTATVATAALTLLLTLAFAGTASAATCSFPPSAYSTGAPWDVENPGPQPVNDPVFPDQWGLEQIKAPAAWARGDTGSAATIAIVDTGVDLGHPDLQSKLVPGADVTEDEFQGCDGPQDENGHGTHVAGIAAAATNNGIGVAGTAPDASIMPVRVLNADGEASDAEVIAGIKHAADNGADVINMSLGGAPIIGEAPPLNEELVAAVDYAYAKGVVIVAAAGNETIPLCSYPAAAAKAICVGATDMRGLPSYYSNFPNSSEDNVGVRAPGGLGSLFCEDTEDIWSSILPDPDAGTGDFCNDEANGDLSGYDTLAGTSMASPFVSGVAALLSAKGLSNAQIMECIKNTSSNQGSFDPVMGYGIVDADAATQSCSASATPSFTPASTSGGGGSTSGGQSSQPADYLAVTVKRISRRKLIRRRKVLVTIRSSRAVSVKLRGVTRRSRAARRKTAGRRTVGLSQAGTRRAYLRISRKAARRLRRNRRTTFQVLYRAGTRSGVAAARR